MNKIDTLILSGGSLKGIAHIGVLKALSDKNILKNIKTIAGTSVGSLIGCLYNIGYSPDELEELLNIINLGLMRDIKMELILKKFGMDEGKKIECVLEELFKNKGIDENITLLELYQKTDIKLIMTTVCINKKETCFLSYETHPNLSVLKGVRMSISIPFWYTPVEYEGNLYADGAIMNNYPISLFRKRKRKIIGVYLYEKNEAENIKNIEDYFFGVFNCVFKGLSDIAIHKYEKQTIKLILPKISIFDLNMDNGKKKELYNYGYEETIKFLNSNFVLSPKN
jgi:NTE family protein